jgi:large subunit ribosomal protein L25
MITLNTEKRALNEDLSKLRAEGFLPAVVYGKKTESTTIKVSQKEFIKVLNKAGESEVVKLKGDSLDIDVLIHDVSKDPVKGTPIHVDFFAFEKGKKIEVSVHLEFEGVSPAVKDLSGNLVKVLHEIKVKSAPESIPHSILVDISKLVTFEDKILAKDLVLPSGVELLEDAEEVIALVDAPRAEEVEEPSAPVDLSSIEVVKKGKKEEEGEATEESK